MITLNETEQPAPVDTDDLPPTQYLILEVLAARHRLGESCWTFPNRLRRAVSALEAAGLVWSGRAPTPGHLRVGLTDAGAAAATHGGYQLPAARIARKAAVDALKAAAARVGHADVEQGQVLVGWAFEVEDGRAPVPGWGR